MKILFRSSIVFIFCSCASNKYDDTMFCQYVPEIPTQIINQFVEAINDTLANVTIQLKSQQEDTFFEFTKIKVSELRTNSFFGNMVDSMGYSVLNVKPGDYIIEINSFESPNFVFDTLHLESGSKYKFEIMLGEHSKYQMVRNSKN